MILENRSNYVVIQDGEQIQLYSYCSKVATITGSHFELLSCYDGGCYGYSYSRTTSKHIRQFIVDYFPRYTDKTISQILKLQEEERQ